MTSNGDTDVEALVTDSIARNIRLLQRCSLKGLIFVNLFVCLSTSIDRSESSFCSKSVGEFPGENAQKSLFLILFE